MSSICVGWTGLDWTGLGQVGTWRTGFEVLGCGGFGTYCYVEVKSESGVRGGIGGDGGDCPCWMGFHLLLLVDLDWVLLWFSRWFFEHRVL